MSLLVPRSDARDEARDAAPGRADRSDRDRRVDRTGRFVGPRQVVVRSARERVALRWAQRTGVVCAALALVLVGVAVLAIGTGSFVISPTDVVRTLLGNGSSEQEFVVHALRLPRVLTAVLAGACLGLAGAIFQSQTRNALGSPDIIGFTTGASTGALVQILLLGAGAASVAVGALVGGLLTSIVVYVLSGGGGAGGYRLILVGIGVNVGLVAANVFLVSRAEFADAQVAVTWTTGNLNGRVWPQVGLLVVTLLALVPVLLAYSRALTMMELCEDSAVCLGVGLARSRVVLLFTGVALTAMAIVAGGPIPFVALAAPQLARRLTGAAGPGLLGSALMGGALLLVCDLLAQRLLDPTQLPVGVMTGSLGGVYLIWLLLSEWRRPHG